MPVNLMPLPGELPIRRGFAFIEETAEEGCPGYIREMRREIINLQDEVTLLKELVERLEHKYQAPPRSQKAKSRPAWVSAIILEVAREAGITPGWLNGKHKNGTRKISVAKRDVIARLRLRGASYPMIGRWLGLHYTSIMYHNRESKKGL